MPAVDHWPLAPGSALEQGMRDDRRWPEHADASMDHVRRARLHQRFDACSREEDLILSRVATRNLQRKTDRVSVVGALSVEYRRQRHEAQVTGDWNCFRDVKATTSSMTSRPTRPVARHPVG